MLHNPGAAIIRPSSHLAPPHIQNAPIIKSPPSTSTSKQPTTKLSRRELAVCTNSLLLLSAPQALQLFNPNKAIAEEIEETPPENKPVEESVKESATSSENSICSDQIPTKKAFLDIAIDGEPAGRIVIGLYEGSVPAGALRFEDLVTGAAGISYRRKEFVKIMPNYVQHGGVRSYGVDAERARRQKGGELTNESLTDEWEKQYEQCSAATTKNVAGSVGIVVRDPAKPPPKLKLVARKGKLEIDQEEVGQEPNGTEFVIATKDSPELYTSVLVVGRVLEGMDVVQRIGQVKTVQDNNSSPYFRVAKLIGDKRAVVAERGFNRPYSKVIVTNCGLME